MAETKHTFCRICEALCGLEVDTTDGRVNSIRPDADHLATDGFACPKGLKQHRILSSPDRLRHPLKRTGDTFEKISWEQALAEIGSKVRRLVGERDADAIAMYVGTEPKGDVCHESSGFTAESRRAGLGPLVAYVLRSPGQHPLHLPPEPFARASAAWRSG